MASTLKPELRYVPSSNSLTQQSDDIWPAWLFARQPGDTITPTWLEALSLIFIIFGAYACGVATALTVRTYIRLRKRRKKWELKNRHKLLRPPSPLCFNSSAQESSKTPPSGSAPSLPNTSIGEEDGSGGEEQQNGAEAYEEEVQEKTTKQLSLAAATPLSDFPLRQHRDNYCNKRISPITQNIYRHSLFLASPVVWERRPDCAVSENRRTWYAGAPAGPVPTTSDEVYQHNDDETDATTSSRYHRSRRNSMTSSRSNRMDFPAPSTDVWRFHSQNSNTASHQLAEVLICDQV